MAERKNEDRDPIHELGARRRDQTAAASLAGIALPGGWRIGAKLDRHSADGRTLSGCNFSVCYGAGDADGGIVIVKAFDFEHTLQSEEPVDEMSFHTSMFQYERDLLTKTSRNRRTARRVIRLLASGTLHCRFEGEATAFPVPYLVLERANRDLRMVLSASAAIDDAWLIACIHDVAAALEVLHTESPAIAHGDAKPSNVMYFEALRRSKLGDFGSATSMTDLHPAIEVRGTGYLGDRTYAPPEHRYGYRASEWDERFRAVDLYLLGQLALYLLTRENMTARILDCLSPNYRPLGSGGSWRGTFADVLPFLETAFEEVIMDLRAHLAGRLTTDIAVELADLIGYLCHPDPARRGHPRNRDPLAKQSRYGLNRFVTAFDVAAQMARIRTRGAEPQG